MTTRHKKNHKATFQISAPTARTVYLAGDFTDWESGAIRLKKVRNGNWSTTVALPAGQHQYRFMIDGNWCDDPAAACRVTNPHGSENCVMEVAAS